MRVTFEFPDGVRPCAMYLNYVIVDRDSDMKMGVRCVTSEDLLILQRDKNRVMRVGADKAWGEPE